MKDLWELWPPSTGPVRDGWPSRPQAVAEVLSSPEEPPALGEDEGGLGVSVPQRAASSTSMAGAAEVLLAMNRRCLVACDARQRKGRSGGRVLLAATRVPPRAAVENLAAAAAASPMLVVGRGHLAGRRPTRRSCSSSSEEGGVLEPVLCRRSGQRAAARGWRDDGDGVRLCLRRTVLALAVAVVSGTAALPDTATAASWALCG